LYFALSGVFDAVEFESPLKESNFIEIGLETISETAADESVWAHAHFSFSSSLRRSTRFGSGSGNAVFSETFAEAAVEALPPVKIVRFTLCAWFGRA
jgi:hypothetical protein